MTTELDMYNRSKNEIDELNSNFTLQQKYIRDVRQRVKVEVEEDENVNRAENDGIGMPVSPVGVESKGESEICKYVAEKQTSVSFVDEK